jgi:hypothetical protein
MQTPSTEETNRIVSEEIETEEEVESKIREAVLRMRDAGTGIPEIKKAIAKQFRNGISIEQVTAIVRENSGLVAGTK